MNLILNIDTSGEAASISLSEEGNIIECYINTLQKDHAAFLHPVIKKLLQATSRHVKEIDAIAVTAGPGSYTGIRVGMASAKGLCTALNKPLITINSLELLAKDAIIHYKGDLNNLFCPMIDARRMEVYTALYDSSLKVVMNPCAMILDEYSLKEFIDNYTIIFFGSGSVKCKNVVKLRNNVFIENVNIPEAMASLSNHSYALKHFTDVVYSEPLYLKEFYNGS